jgi:thiol-disulfide isomerase/thioredoxin
MSASSDALRALPARVGQILVAPRAALRRIDAEGGGLRDAVWLVAVGVIAFRLPELCRALLAIAGPTSGVVMRLVGLFLDEAKQAAWAVLPAAVIVTATAGARRDATRDLDLGAACYAPYFVLRGIVRVIETILGVEILPPMVVDGIAGLGALAVLVPAIGVARARGAAAAGAVSPEPAPDARARRAGGAVVLLSLAALASGGVWSARHLDALQPMQRGQAAPAFALPRLDGNGTVALSELRGQVVLLDFWATWCSPCVAMLPVLDSIHHDWEARGVAFVGVNSDGGGATLDEIKSFVGEHHIPYPVVADDGSVGALYKVEALPTLVIVGKDGSVRKSFVGYTTQGALDRALRDALGN